MVKAKIAEYTIIKAIINKEHNGKYYNCLERMLAKCANTEHFVSGGRDGSVVKSSDFPKDLGSIPAVL